jgi:ferredoxin--NADP+ reductase
MDAAAQTDRHAAIVGAGPAGFYAADQLLNAGFQVDMYDALPTPYGLVRAGVAPDHPKIKNVTKVYDKTAAREGFRFFGGVRLGVDISRADLLERYHVVLYSFGTSTDNQLGIPGEDLPGSHAATEFVGWYNGHPDFADHAFHLRGGRAVVIGNGNVAMDVARMLVLEPDEVSATDTADHAIEALADATVEEVVMLGRRGPAQAAFTNPELRELGELSRADVVVDPADLELDPVSAAWLESDDATPTNRRNVDIMRAFAANGAQGRSHRVVLRFLTSPVEIIGTDRVEAIRVVRNRIEAGDDGRLRAVPTGEEEVIPCDVVFRSIGYRGIPVGDIPFDERRGLVRNTGGRVCDEEGRSHRGEYVAGWIKRGPSGVIGTNKKDAADTVARIVEDAEAGTLNEPARPDPDDTAAWLAERVPDAVTWQGWQAIDEAERQAGEPHGRPRVKIVRLADLVAAAKVSSGTR